MAQYNRHNYQPLNLTDLFRANSKSLILFETAPAATFLYRRPLHCSSNYHSCTGGHFPVEAATSPAPATIFLHQQISADTSSAPAATSPAPATFLHQRLPVLHQQLLVLHQWPPSCTSDHLPAPVDTSSYQFCTSNYQSWTNDYFPAPADTSNYQSWTSDHLPAPADTNPKPATIFLHQRKPVLHQGPSIQQIIVLYQLSRHAPVTRSCSNDHHPALAIVCCTLFWLRFAIIKFGLLKQHPCFVILA